jgi:hypothetical protein
MLDGCQSGENASKIIPRYNIPDPDLQDTKKRCSGFPTFVNLAAQYEPHPHCFNIPTYADKKLVGLGSQRTDRGIGEIDKLNH